MEDNSVQDMPTPHSQSKEETVAIFKAPPSLQPMEDTGPVPLSFPSDYRHLFPVQAKKVWRRNDNEGKRWVRRRENARFTDNPHITAPSKRDLEPPLPTLLTTFPVPLPPYLPRSAPLPASTPPATDAKASSAGQFSLSLRGMRKALRRSGARTEALVRGVEDELTRWLGEFPGRAVAGEEGIREVERSPQRLVWWIENDTWARYVVHCCARYHGVVSFSKDTPTHRLTHILRPNVTRPDPATRAALATPPPTDLDFSSLSSHDSDLPSSLSDVQSIDGASDVLSEADFASDPESPTRLQLQPRAALGHRLGRRCRRIRTGLWYRRRRGQRSRTGDRGPVLGERRRDAARRPTLHERVPHAGQGVGSPLPRALGIVAVALACALEAASSIPG
ncbi:hypothetical protein EDB87DRAFT_1712526 [Lactarius vividus]|nr:hypothetical protein EDB87DRAFT_1712526 [Lactarius vividus]